MNILVTGADGQLGMSLRKISPEYPSHKFVFTDLPEGDITDPRKIGALIEAGSTDVIINCAAYTAVEKAEIEPELAAKINTQGPALLASLAGRYGCRLVHISTDYVFGGDGCKPYTEEDATGPVSVYGSTKLAGEEAVRRQAVDAAVVRTAWLYSEFGNNFVKTMLRLAAGGRTPEVVADQRGTPTYAPDLARAVMTLVDKGIKGFELYHFTDGGGEISWYDFAVAIFREAGLGTDVIPVTTDRFPSAVRRPAYSVLDKSKITSAGATVPYWSDSLRDCIAILLKEQRNNKL